MAVSFLLGVKNEKIKEHIVNHNSLYGVVLFVSLLFLVYGKFLFHNNIWYDEAYQLVQNRHSLFAVVDYVAKDFSPPLYAIMLKLLTMVFGHSLIVGRVLSISAFVGMIYLAFYPMKKLFNIKTSIVFSSFLLTMPVTFFASIEIRTYSWPMFLILGMFLYGLFAFKENKCSYWWLYFFFGVASMYAHNYAIAGAWVINQIFFIYMLMKKREYWKKYLLVRGLMILCFLPWLHVLLSQAHQLTENFWISKPNQILWKLCYEYLIYPHILVQASVILGSLVGLVTLIREDRKNIWPFLFSIVSFGITILIMVLLSLYKVPLFIPKYMVPICGLFYLGISILFGHIKTNWVFLFFVLLLYIGVPAQYQIKKIKSDDRVAKQMVLDLKKEELFLFHKGEDSLGVLEYYFPGSHHYIADDFETVLTDLSVFSNDIHPKEKLNELDHFYLVNVSFTELEEYVGDHWKVAGRKKYIIPYCGTYEFIYLERRKDV